MSLEIKNDKAWWSTNPKYDSIQIPFHKTHEAAAKDFFDAHPKDRPSIKYAVQAMEELGFIRVVKGFVNGTMFIEGIKSAIRKIIPSLLRFLKENSQIRYVIFEYEDGNKFKTYDFFPGETKIYQLTSEFD